MTPKAALYARFSSENQRDEGIDAQIRAIHEYELTTEFPREEVMVYHKAK